MIINHPTRFEVYGTSEELDDVARGIVPMVSVMYLGQTKAQLGTVAVLWVPETGEFHFNTQIPEYMREFRGHLKATTYPPDTINTDGWDPGQEPGWTVIGRL